MKVLLVNKFYRHSGGDCIHFLALEKLLREKGGEVAVLTMQHPQNLPLPPGAFEVSRVSIDGSLTQKVKAVSRILGGEGIRKSAREAITTFKPDVVHLHNIHSYISPAVADEAHKAGIPVVWTLHDYKLICNSYSCLRSGNPCVDCISDPLAVVRHRCMKQSLAASLVALAESGKWNRIRLQKSTDTFICPSSFMRDKMIEGGISSESLAVLPNFITVSPDKLPEKKRNGVCYIGRLSAEKGLEYLLDAAVAGGWQLTVAGGGPLADELKAKYAGFSNILFVGQLDSNAVVDLLAESCLSVVPSVWYENNPLSVIESLSVGTPVAASRIGGLPELIDSTNGTLFEPRSYQAINEAVQQLLSTDFNHAQISRNALERFSPDDYYSRLLTLYSSKMQ